MSVFVKSLSNSIDSNDFKEKNTLEKWEDAHKNATQKINLIADTRAIAPRPYAPNSVQIFRAVLPKDFNKNQFIYSQNDLPMNSMILNIEIKDGSVFLSDKIARAALKANPNIQFIIPLAEKFSSTDDIEYKKRSKNISDSWQVPAKNIVLVSSSMGQWPQDGIAFGKSGIVRGNPLTDPDHKTTANEATDMASALGLSVAEESEVGRFGDTQLFSKKDGSQVVVFSHETMHRVLSNKLGGSFDSRDTTHSQYMVAIGLIMKQFATKGIALSNVLPIGSSKLTYGDVLNKMSVVEKKKIDPNCLKELKKRRNLPFPEKAIKYHTDTVVFSAGNDIAFINETDKQKYPELTKQLLYAGLKPVSLPSINTDVRSAIQDKYIESLGVDLISMRQDKDIGGDLRSSYLNAISGISAGGRILILMPTESSDSQTLTVNDKKARKTIMDSIPNSIVIPIGGKSALEVIGLVPLKTGGSLNGKDYGPHCLSKLTPFIIQSVKPKR